MCNWAGNPKRVKACFTQQFGLLDDGRALMPRILYDEGADIILLVAGSGRVLIRSAWQMNSARELPQNHRC